MAALRSIRLRLEGLDTRVVPAVDIATPTDDPDTVVVTTVDDTPEDDTTVIDTDDEATTTDDETDVEGGVLDGEIIQNADGESVPSTAVDLALTGVVSKAAPGLGDVISVTLTVTNKGDLLSTGSTVSVTVPAGMTFVKATPQTGTTYDATAGTWTLDLLGPTETATLKLDLKVTDTAAMAVGAAIGSAEQADPKADNNSVGLAVSPVLSKLVVTQAVSTATPVVGSWVVYTVMVRNAGPGNGTAVKVAETLPEGLAGVRVAAASQGWYNASTTTWHVGKITPGTVAVLRLVGQVTRTGSMVASAELTANGMNAETSKTSASATLTGTRENIQANWVYLSGKNFQTGKTIQPAKPFVKGPIVIPSGPIPGVPNNPQAQAAAKILIAKGFVFKGLDVTPVTPTPAI